jgi:hypothetical protein
MESIYGKLRGMHPSIYIRIALPTRLRIPPSDIMPSSTDNAKKAKIKLGVKTVFYKYQERELEIKAARVRKEQQDALDIQLDNDDDELLDAELYKLVL